MTSTSAPAPTKHISRVAVPFLGVMAAIQGLDPNIANTALIGVSRGLDMEGSMLALGASISTLALAASVISTGLLADRVGRRKVLMAALLVAAAGDLIVAAAPTSGIYMLGRAVTGVGLGAVYGASFAYIRAVVPPARIPGAIGIFAATTGFVTLALTFLGGNLAAVDWRIAFLVVPAASILCFFAVPVLLPPEPPLPGGKQDVLGQVLLAIGVIGVLYGFSQLGTSFTAPLTVVPLLVGVASLAAFFVFESRSPDKFFPVELFRQPVFLAAVLAGFAYNFGMAVSYLQLANLWQYVNGLTTSEVAVWQLPFMFSGITAALVFSRLMLKKVTSRMALLIGSVLAAGGFFLLAAFHGSTSLWGFLPGAILTGSGVIIVSLPFGNLIMSQAPAKYFGPVTSSRTTIGQFFYAAGLALATVMVDRLTTGGIVAKLTAAGVPPTQTGSALDAVTAYASQGTHPSTSVGKEALADAASSYGDAFAVTMFVGGVLILIAGLVGVWLLAGREPRPGAAPASQPEAATSRK